MFGNETIRRASCPVVEPYRGVGFLMINHHHPFGPRKGVFHGGKPPAQRSQLLFGEFVAGWRRRLICGRSDPLNRQREWYDIRLLRHFVPSPPSWAAFLQPCSPERGRSVPISDRIAL